MSRMNPRSVFLGIVCRPESICPVFFFHFIVTGQKTKVNTEIFPQSRGAAPCFPSIKAEPYFYGSSPFRPQRRILWMYTCCLLPRFPDRLPPTQPPSLFSTSLIGCSASYKMINRLGTMRGIGVSPPYRCCSICVLPRRQGRVPSTSCETIFLPRRYPRNEC